MPPQLKAAGTGLAVCAGAFTLALAGPGAGTPAQAASCPPGQGLVSTLTGVVCATTDTATSAGKRLLDGGTGGATAPVTGTVKKTADGLAGGVHDTANRAESGTSDDDGDGAGGGTGGGARREPDGGEKAARPAERPWTTFPDGFTPRERSEYLDARRLAPPYPVLPPAVAPAGLPGTAALPGVQPPQVAPRQPVLLAGGPEATVDEAVGRPSPAAVAGAAAAAGAVLALHLGMVDTWRRRRVPAR